MTRPRDQLVTVLWREFRTLRHSREYVALTVGFGALLVGVVAYSGARAYVPLSMTLLPILELLVPVLAAALGYRPIVGDRERGELAVLRTYPVSRAKYVLGVYLGRLAALLAAVVVPLSLLALAVPLSRVRTRFAQPAGLDSPVLYLRFIVLTAVFAAVMLAILTLLSALSGRTRRGYVGVVALLLALVLGADLLAVVGLASFGPGWAHVAAASPNGAYRSLVVALVLKPVTTTPLAGTAPALSALLLVSWLVGALIVAVWQVWRPAE